MKNQPSIYFLVWTTMLIVVSCGGQESIKSRDYVFEVSAYGMPGDKWYEAFMYNADINTYSPERRGGVKFTENTLYVLKHTYSENLRSIDTLKLKLTLDQVDSLYSLTYNYLSNFKINKEVVPGKAYQSVSDGTNFSVSLKYNDKLMSCAQYRTKGLFNSSREARLLFEFVNRKVPKEFKLY